MKPLPSHNTHPPHSCCRPLLTRWQCTECLQWARLCSKYCTYNSELSEQFPHLLELWSQQRRKTIKNKQKCHTSIDKYHEEETRWQWDSDRGSGDRGGSFRWRWSEGASLSMNLGSEGESPQECLSEERICMEAWGEGRRGRKSDEGRGCGFCPQCDRSRWVLRKGRWVWCTYCKDCSGCRGRTDCGWARTRGQPPSVGSH